jgi:glucose-6-phosphate isomerase
MLPSVNPMDTAAWRELEMHFLLMQATHIRELFEHDRDRFAKFHLQFEDILVDISKNIINEDTIKLLTQLAEEVGLGDAIQGMFTGQSINRTENRAVLHVALRNRANTPIEVDGNDVMPGVNAVLNQMKSFSDKLLTGEWKGYTG